MQMQWLYKHNLRGSIYECRAHHDAVTQELVITISEVSYFTKKDLESYVI